MNVMDSMPKCCTIYQVCVVLGLLYVLGVVLLNKGQLEKLEKFHIEILKNIQSLPTRTATSIVYLLLGALPLKAEIERRQLDLFIRNTRTLIQVIVACRKLVPDVLPNNTEILNIIESI